MLLSKLLGERYKEKPSDATIPSHIFLLKGGYIRHVTNGIFTLLPPAKKIARKIEQILREEMDAIDGQEVLFPVAMPASLWEESGRYQSVGKELLRFTDRGNIPMVLGMTHEEAAVHLAQTEAMSYTKYPFMIYQIQTKFRDEPRSRGGLIRVREFTMKDGYSFHTTQEDLEQYYAKCHEAYEKIYARVGVPEVVSVKSDSGMMGGSIAHEFMLLCDAGEDTIALCHDCDYKSNVEAATTSVKHSDKVEASIAKVHTPDVKDIDSLSKFFDVDHSHFIKATVFAMENEQRPVVVFIRGDYEVNEAKLRSKLGADIFPYSGSSEDSLEFGFIGPYGLDFSQSIVLFDESLRGENDMICGANEADHHLKGVSVGRDLGDVEFCDLSKVNEGDTCPVCGGKLYLKRGVEVGNIFQLGTKYTESMGMSYIDQNGKSQHPIMGCYGIGVGRLLACVIEAKHDDYGPIWPYSIAPWHIHICALNRKKGNVAEVANSIYEKLSGKYEVIMDDRDVQAGIQFADADLLGVPIRIIVSQKNTNNGQVEIATRDKSVKTVVDIDNLEKTIEEIVKNIV